MSTRKKLKELEQELEKLTMVKEKKLAPFANIDLGIMEVKKEIAETKLELKEKELEVANSILKKKEFIYYRDFMGPYIKINGEDEYIIIYMNETQEEYIENHIKELKEDGK